MENQINLPFDEGENQPNKVTDEEPNKVQIKVNRQIDLLELIKLIKDEQDNIQRDKDEGQQSPSNISG
jgi:hypothetical protein